MLASHHRPLCRSYLRLLAAVVAGAACSASFVPAALAADSSPDDVSPTYVPFDVSVFPPVNLFHPDRKVIVGVSANAIYGKAASVYGVEVGTIYNRETEDVGGIQIAAGGNNVDGRCLGVQISGAAGGCGDRSRALQVAGFVSVVGEEFSGVQIGGLFNLAESAGAVLQIGAGGNYVGDGGAAQIGLVNDAERSLDGLQISLIINFANQTVPVKVGTQGNYDIMESTVYPNAWARGVFVSGSNVAQNLAGLQIAWLINGVASEFEGVQIAPLFNFAGNVKGVQISAINGAESVDGIQVGAVNVTGALRGVQIGGINVAYRNGLPFMVGLNAGF